MGKMKAKMIAAALVAVVASAPAFAGNGGFETGDLTDWSSTNWAGATTGIGVFSPVEGNYLGFVQGTGAWTYSTLSQSFTLAAGQSLTGSVGYQTTDYEPYEDDGYLSVNGVNIFTATTGAVGNFGNTGWVTFNFVAPTAGNYVLELGVRNWYDGAYSPIAVLDNVHTAGGAVPEPASWAMMLGGFGLIGGVMRSRRSAVSFA